MKFDLTEEHLMIRDAARDFAQNELLPGVIERDENQTFPSDQVKKMPELGIMGMMVSPDYGGGGMDTISYVLAMEEISKVDASAAVIMSVNNSLVCWGLETYGTKEQKDKYLRTLASGETIGAFCLSEPESGSDATQQKTTAQDKGDHYLLNGTKNWITHGLSGDVAVVLIRTGDLLDSNGITAFIIEKGTPGFSSGKKEDKLGIRSSDTCTLVLNNCKVPKENVLGEVGKGFPIAMNALDNSRIGIAAQGLGIAQGAYEAALKYSKERKTFGKPIAAHQSISNYLADMAVKIDAARLQVYKAAWAKQEHYENGSARHTLEASIAKLNAGDTAMWVSERAVQVLGGYGYTKDFPVERFFRDAKITQIYEGTQEVQRLVIAREISK